MAPDKIKEKGIKAKRSYDRWVRSSVLEPGDRVLVRNLTERGGPGKLGSFWENNIYVVVNRKGPESPVYETKRENGKGKNRVLHRNLLPTTKNLKTHNHLHQNHSQQPCDNNKDNHSETLQRRMRKPPATKNSPMW